MPDPRLIHPISVQIEQIDKADTVYRGRAKEPVRQAARTTTVTLDGQIAWNFHGDPKAEAAGIRTTEDGYVCFLLKDILAAGITLKRGDKFTQFGSGVHAVSVNLYVTYVDPHGHYPGQDGPTLMFAYFEDRQPTRSAG